MRKVDKYDNKMTKKYTPEEIKNRLSNIGAIIGNIALDYITQLENKIADIKANCDLAIEGRDIKIKELEKGCNETQELLDKQIEATYKLDKENAELKRDKEDLIFVRNAKADHICELKDQLTKAKELLAKWVELFKPKGSNIPPTPIQVETEQFLKGE